MLNGRYGADKLGYIMISCSVILTIVAALLKAENFIMKVVLLIVSAGILCYAVFRVFSKDIKARERELRALEILKERLSAMLDKEPTETNSNENNSYTDKDEKADADTKKDQDEFRHFRCPRCKKPLKVPSGKGNIKVICPACSHKFMKRT